MHTTLPPEAQHPRIILLGMECNFTNRVLQSLIEKSPGIVVVILPGPPRERAPVAVRPSQNSIPLAPVTRTDGVTALAMQQGIPVYRFGRLASDEALAALASFEADMLISVCFPRLIPLRVTSSYPGRAFNVHPSLLPALRGPDPLFWTFREGSGEAGITIHELAPELDAGPIVAQEQHSYQDGTTEDELEAELARRAGEIIAGLASVIASGESPHPFEQNHAQATYAPLPTNDDYHLDTLRSARFAYNFVRGIEGRGHPITVDFQGRERTIARVQDYTGNQAWTQSGNSASAIPFRDGFLIAELVEDGH